MNGRACVLRFAATIIALAAPTTAEALPPGQSFLKCDHGVIYVDSVIGNLWAFSPPHAGGKSSK
jgi:hypothetical protein